jgi:transposase
MSGPALLPDPNSLRLLHLEVEPQCITAVIATTAPDALCPVCQHLSNRVHSRYQRFAADLPWAGWAVRLRLHVRRFFCGNRQCERQIFAERLPKVLTHYSRRTIRLTEVLTVVGFALGGEAGKRLLSTLRH